jgi:lysophospholipase L1-like esterase
MKRVILIGDSIRMGYQPVVTKELEGLAGVWGPSENGGTSDNVLAHLDEWAVSREADLVHVNCGLHDIKRLRDADDIFVPLERYRSNVTEILRTLVERTSARVIWATTTPVNQTRHAERKGFDRYERDVADYNRTAVDVARELGVEVNNLWETVMRSGRDALLGEDGVHFTQAGYGLLGSAVARAARGALGG